MSREEAIAFGKRILLIAATDDDKTAIEFTKMAIQALSQEPTDKPMCDRNICLNNEYNGIGCDECIVNKAEQEPCTDTVSIRKDALKTRIGNIVAYNVEWLKKHWQMEMDIVCGVKPCDDAVSRDAALIIAGTHTLTVDETVKAIKNLPPVTQKSETVTEFADRCRECGAKYGKLLKQKTGEWIEDAKTYYEELKKRGLGVDEYTPYFTDDIACSECLAKYNILDNETQFFKYCPNCGAKMERGEKE